MEENKKIEMTDEELDKVVGGFNIGDHVVANARMIRYCPGCGKLAIYSYGTVVGIIWYEKGQHYFLDIKTDCCGHVERRGNFACELTCFACGTGSGQSHKVRPYEPVRSASSKGLAFSH